MARPEDLDIDSGPILLVGNTVRYLAQSARRAGIAVCGVDAYGDLDTRLACQRHRRSAGPGPGALIGAVRDWEDASCAGWSYAAGFETAPDLLAQLVRRRRGLLGNEPGVLQHLARPQRFLQLLGELDIAHPRSLPVCPAEPGGWLFKPAGRFGGQGVRLAREPARDEPGFYQEFVKGPLCSLLFAANGRDARVIGFNRLLARYPAAGDFRFAGAVSGLAPPASPRRTMELAAQRLTRALGLRGVNGLDFVLRGGEEPLLLELNARPTASLDLYETALARGGLACHLDACRGRLPDVEAKAPVRGMRVVYARRALRMPVLDWPSWASDRPGAGERIGADAPLCTVHASGGDMDAVEARLRERADALVSLLGGLSVEAA